MSLWLALHLFGVVLFVGDIVTAAFWKARADRTRNPVEIHSAVKNLMLADYLFTIPGLILIIVSGSGPSSEPSPRCCRSSFYT